MNFSTNIPQPKKIKRDPQPVTSSSPKGPLVAVGSLDPGQHFYIPGDEDEDIPDRGGVVLVQSQGVTRVKFDPRLKEYTYPENIATSTQVVLLEGVK